MASGLALLVPVFLPISTVLGAFAVRAALKVDWQAAFIEFVTGPGRTSRLLLVFFVIANWKNMPLAWTYRIMGSLINTYLFAGVTRTRLLTTIKCILTLTPIPPFPQVDPTCLYRYGITVSHAPLLEIDYNIHKSNSTYFADLDVARSHVVSSVLREGMRAVTAVGLDPKLNTFILDKEGKPIQTNGGKFGIGLGSVFCSFKKEIPPYKQYELWTKILCWDRKWLYILTHFVMKGKVSKKTKDKNWSKENVPTKYIYATAISKYVFKLGRYTVHPAIVIEQSGMLPERPGSGWRGEGVEDLGSIQPGELDGVDASTTRSWKTVEWQRRKGMEYAAHFAALDAGHELFDGGIEGATGPFSPG